MRGHHDASLLIGDPLQLPTKGNWVHKGITCKTTKAKKAEYKGTQQVLPDIWKFKTQIMQAFWLVGLFCQKRLSLDPYFQVLAQILVE